MAVSVDLLKELLHGGVPACDDPLAGGAEPALWSGHTLLTEDVAVPTLTTHSS